ncbi:alpha/beta fold hydrolase, partial [candidate division GN15 bacterium]|nr:alpha/beta fold hydrolase [candidate division GN15 bacterium]
MRLFLTLIMTVVLCASVLAQAPGRVDQILEQIDPWVTTDTAKIMEFIDSANAVTTEKLESSPHWESTMRDLSFLLGIDYIGSPQIDNTGRIYFVMRITGEAEALFYIDEPMSWPHQLTPNNWSEEGLTISGFNVHPSGDFLLVSTNKHGDEMHDIWHFTRDGKFKQLLESRSTRYAGTIFNEQNPDEFWLYIDNMREMHIGKYTISTQTLDTIYSEAGAFYPIDVHDEQMVFVRWMSFSESQLAMLDLSTNDVTDLTDITLVWGAGFTKDGRLVVLTSAESTEDEFMKLCLLDPATPKEFSVLYDPGMETDGYMVLEEQGVVVMSLNNDSYSQLAAIDLEGNPVQIPQLEIGVLGGQSASDMAANDSGDVVLSFSSPKQAPTAFTFSLGDSEMQQIGEVSTFGFDFSNVNVEVIRYPSEEGWDIPALLYTPKDVAKDGTNPAIISYHGGPPSQSRPVFQRNIAFALSQGFVVMFPNVRGSTGYGPAYERADNLEGRWGSLVDCEKAIDYLIDQGYSSPEKIAVWGGSYGGYVVNWLATHASEKIACVVSIVGVSDVDHTNRNSSQVFAKGWEKEYGPVGSDLTRELSPIFYAEDVAVPMLVT